MYVAHLELWLAHGEHTVFIDDLARNWKQSWGSCWGLCRQNRVSTAPLPTSSSGPHSKYLEARTQVT